MNDLHNQVTEDEIEKKKRSLKRYKKNQLKINRLVNKLNDLIDRIESVKSPNLSGMPRGGTPTTLDELMANKIEYEERIKSLKRKGKELRKEILAEIDLLDDVRYCEILEAFFIDLQTLEDIAANNNYSKRQVDRLYSKGIIALINVDKMSVECQ
ncbi:MAG: hypothetical protein VZQ55_05525 [Ruminococcus sp.]|nr:hypothetical protein [Ruminococcus sp.]